VDYDGDLYWVNINRRGELWVNTKEKSRPVFRTVQARGSRRPRRPAAEPEAAQARGEADPRQRKPGGATSRRPIRAPGARASGGPGPPRQDPPLMRKNRREPGGSGSMSFLSRALKCSERRSSSAFTAMGLSPGAGGRSAGLRRDRGRDLVAQQGQPRRIWINAREKRGEEAPRLPGGAAAGAAPDSGGPAPGNVLAAVRLLLKETKTGSVAAPVGAPWRATSASRSTSSRRAHLVGLRCPRSPREAGVCGARGRDLLAQPQREGRALAQRQGLQVFRGGRSGGHKGRRPRPKKKDRGRGTPPPPRRNAAAPAAPRARRPAAQAAKHPIPPGGPRRPAPPAS
jgi:hypothetical protein